MYDYSTACGIIVPVFLLIADIIQASIPYRGIEVGPDISLHIQFHSFLPEDDKHILTNVHCGVMVADILLRKVVQAGYLLTEELFEVCPG